MKKIARIVLLSALTAVLICCSALADTGPKPQLTVRVKNAPEELYYLDILGQGAYEGPTYGSGDSEYSGLSWNYSDDALSQLDPSLLEALRAAVPEDWHACTAQGTNDAPMWGDLVGQDTGTRGLRIHTFGYVGTPETYRILIATASGSAWVSAPYTRHALQSSVTVDWATRTVSVPPIWVSYVLQFICTLLPTLLVEGVILFAFGYRTKKSWRSFFLVNLVTQGAFAVYLAIVTVRNGVNGWSLFFYIPIELVILIAELLAYRLLLTEHSPRQAGFYAVAANVLSAFVGLGLIEPLWRFIVTIS